MNPSTKVCVVAAGARTPVGRTAASSAAAIRAGITRIGMHPYMINKDGDPFTVAMDPSLPEEGRSDRMFGLASAAIAQILAQLPTRPDLEIPLYLGLPELGPRFDRDTADRLRRRLVAACSDRGQLKIHVVTEGNAAAGIALERAVLELESDRHPYVLFGGVDSFIDVDVLESFDEEGRLACESERWGFHAGEGAAVLALSSLSFARANRLQVLGRVAAVQNGVEPKRMGTDTICIGEGLAATMTAAAQRVGARITKQYCDLDGDRYREHEFSYALLRVPHPVFVDAVDYVSPANAWGHTGAATLALLGMLPLLHNQRGHWPGRWPMVWSGSESGRRSVVVFELERRNA